MFTPDSYRIIAELFPRMLGVIYFFALSPFLFQIRGLLGKKGILPVERFLNFHHQRLGKRRFYWIPSVFWWNASDRALVGVVAVGTVLSILLVFGVYPALLMPMLIIIHLSILSVGQDFLSFGWEGFFLEIAYNGFLLTLTNHPNLFVWINLNLLIFRFHVMAGTIKLQGGDPVWRNCTALFYHYQTQPIPNAISWYAHKFPQWVQKFSTGFMFFVEIFIPVLILGTEEMRLIAFGFFVLLQLGILSTGNFSYLSFMTLVLVTPLVSDPYLQPIFGATETLPSSPLIINILVSIAALALIALQLIRFWFHFFPSGKIARFFGNLYPYHLANSYALFAHMTTTRFEVVVEGSYDNENWKEYHFRYKPSELDRRPRQISPFQPRLDWQMWFLPFSYYEDKVWFQNFIYRLFEGSPEVLNLLRENPFPEKPPRYLRSKMYVYEFSDAKTKKSLGYWWVRNYVRQYSPTLDREEMNLSE